VIFEHFCEGHIHRLNGIGGVDRCAGIGSTLIRSGLAGCRELGYGAVVVLGHPDYYPRFGFTPADPARLRCVYDIPAEAFMILELQPGYLQNVQGIVTYHPAFDSA